MAEILEYRQDGDIAVLMMDDGKANACGFDMLGAIREGLDQASRDARAVVLHGRPGLLSGGFDLKVINSGNQAEVERMVALGVRTLMQLYGHPQPLVIAATGHAVALGAFMLLCGDYRIGTQGDFRIGLNETAIGLTLPAFAIELATARLTPRHLTRAAIAATMYLPEEAAEAGFLDAVAPPEAVISSAMEQSRTWAAYDSAIYAANKTPFRRPLIQRVLGELEAR